MSNQAPVPVASRRQALVVVVLGSAPLLVGYFVGLWGKPYYRCFPLALIGGGMLAWRGLRSLQRPLAPGSPLLSLPLLGVGWLLLAAATVGWSPWLGAVATGVILVGAIWWQGGWRLARPLLPALVMGLTVLSPPLGLDQSVMHRLQGFVLSGAGRMLYALQVPHVTWWSNVELAGRKVPMSEVFTGLNLLPGLLVVCLFYLLWRRRHVLHVALSLAAASAFAVSAEVARVALGLRACDAGGLDFFAGWTSAAVAWGLAGLGFLLLLSVDQLFVFLGEPRQPSEAQIRAAASAPATPVPEPASPAAPVLTKPSLAWGLAGAFAVLGLAQLGFGWRHHQHAAAAESPLPAGILEDRRWHLPEVLGDWKQVGDTNFLARLLLTPGARCQRWCYQKGDLVLALGLDYPWRGSPSPVAAYRDADWRLLGESALGLDTNSIPPGGEVEMSLDPVLRGTLYYGSMSPQGQWLPATAPRSRWEFPRRPAAVAPLAYRGQALVLGGRKLEPTDRQSAHQAIAIAWTQWSRQAAAPPRNE